MTSKEIRQSYIDFFVQKHGHTFVPSSSVVPWDDPTLLFTNAGMNQFKPLFLGQEKRGYTRAVNTQKSIRAGGKHNDLDDVGRSRRHHTFFEMLGNWSFGDYFKQGAIEMAWELLTKVWKLDPSRLHVTCFEGDEKNGVPRDTEAADIWKKVAGLPDDHIHYFGKDNFWEMGDTGPCGPCTEIYVDRTPDKAGGKDVNGDDPRVMEIWNLVFIQYNRNNDRSLTVLPAQHVDTGMGLERVCQVIQDVQDNYATDLFTPLFDAITKLTGIEYTGSFPKTNKPDPAAEATSPQLRHDIAFRVIADHVRCLTFALTDGAVPSNEGRGYVLRRILRRAVRFGRQSLNVRDPFLFDLVPVIIETMGDAFPELKKNPGRVSEIIKEEEVGFGKTIDRGIDLFEEAAERGKSGNTISAPDAFRLHDTYGFPIDLTRIMAEERGMSVDMAGYEQLMEEAKELARSGGKGKASAVYELPPAVLADLEKQGVAKTDDSAKFENNSITAKVVAVWNGSQLWHDAVRSNEEIALILDRTNFYAEMGGQVGDSGEIALASGSFHVETTRTVGGFVLHVGKLKSGQLKAGDNVTATVSTLRNHTQKNHTATHLANWALREVLGEGVQQKGSLVDAEKLRFDFSHGKSLSDDEIAKTEKLVNDGIARKMPVYAEVAPQEQALKINGLRAVFGEKYPSQVRVVSIGAPVKDLLADPPNSTWREYSVEFCGGTHLTDTSDIENFVITSEESVSKGIRRLVALTGVAASAACEKTKSLLESVKRAQQSSEQDIPKLTNELQRLGGESGISLTAKRQVQHAIAELQQKHKLWEKSRKASTGSTLDAATIAADLLSVARTLSGGPAVVAEVKGASDDELRSVMDSLRKKSPTIALMLASTDGVKITFIAAVSDDLIAKGLKAGDWIRETAKAAGGGGGGRPNLAQAGGKDPSKIGEALEVAKAFVGKVLG